MRLSLHIVVLFVNMSWLCSYEDMCQLLDGVCFLVRLVFPLALLLVCTSQLSIYFSESSSQLCLPRACYTGYHVKPVVKIG